jgi:hypothetical protein
MKTKGYWVLKGLKFVVLGAVFVVVAGFVVMWLWNWLMPSLFGLGTVTWLQALGLLVLAKILFGMGGHRGGWGGNRHGCGGYGKHGHWRKKWEQKWSQMSEAEKASVRAQWGKHCGGSPEDFMQDKPQEESGVAGA